MALPLARVFRPRRNQPVMGVVAEGPRFTRWAAIYFFGYVAAPFLSFCLAADIGLYFLFKNVFHRCYGILCLFE
jgi:hypothetical protein